MYRAGFARTSTLVTILAVVLVATAATSYVVLYLPPHNLTSTTLDSTTPAFTQVIVGVVNFPTSAVSLGSATKAQCGGTQPSGWAWLSLVNSGVVNANLTGFSTTFGGESYSATPAGPCVVGTGGGIFYLFFHVEGQAPSPGDFFTGFVTFSSGQSAAFSGQFK